MEFRLGVADPSFSFLKEARAVRDVGELPHLRLSRCPNRCRLPSNGTPDSKPWMGLALNISQGFSFSA